MCRSTQKLSAHTTLKIRNRQPNTTHRLLFSPSSLISHILIHEAVILQSELQELSWALPIATHTSTLTCSMTYVSQKISLPPAVEKLLRRRALSWHALLQDRDLEIRKKGKTGISSNSKPWKFSGGASSTRIWAAWRRKSSTVKPTQMKTK